MSSTLSKKQIFGVQPEPWEGDLLPAIQRTIRTLNRKLWILDDDPTGTQTVANIPVITNWEIDTLKREFEEPDSACFILTNSRSLTEIESESLHSELARNLMSAAEGRGFSIISRSDSTLRGHFPLETDVLSKCFGKPDILLLCPFFEQGGRFTITDTHYVEDSGELIPAAETSFAQDRSFGYKHSNLRTWIEEKTRGKVKREEVVSLGLNLIRLLGPKGVLRKLETLPTESVVIVNAICQKDVEVVASAILLLEAQGKRILVRSAASFVASRAGQTPPPLITDYHSKNASTSGGLVVVGSYVPKTSNQLKELITNLKVISIEIDVPSILDIEKRHDQLSRAIKGMNRAIRGGKDVVLHTSREVISGDDATSNLKIGSLVSQFLIDIVKRIDTRPSFLIAKGGITSSDIATKALGIKRAKIVGQILPGIPVWRTGPEALFEELNYVIFPGNVGNEFALLDAVNKLKLR